MWNCDAIGDTISFLRCTSHSRPQRSQLDYIFSDATATRIPRTTPTFEYSLKKGLKSRNEIPEFPELRVAISEIPEFRFAISEIPKRRFGISGMSVFF